MAEENSTVYTFLLSGVYSDNKPMYARATDTDYPVIVMDVIPNYTISLNNRVSNYAIESRSNISDHIFSENTKISFTARMGSAWPVTTALLGNSVFTYDSQNSIATNRPLQAYKMINKLRDEKLAFDVLTEQELFTNMVITELSVAKEGADDSITFNISLEKIRKVEIGKTVLASTAISPSSKTSKGKEISNKTAPKTSTGSKTSGDTNKVEEKGTYVPAEKLEQMKKAYPTKKLYSDSGREIE